VSVVRRLGELQFNLLCRPIQVHDSKTANLPRPHRFGFR